VTLTRLATSAAHAVVLAYGWRRAGIAFIAGAASALALAPVNAWPILFLTFPVLIWLVDGSTAGRWNGVWSAAIAGWCFGFGYFLCGLYWVGYAFLVDAKTFGWLLPVAVGGLPAYLAIYTGLGLAAARLIWVRGAERILALAAMLTIAEWLRGHLLSGFPWNTFGYALTSPLVLAQSVSLVGIWGLTFFAIAIFPSRARRREDGYAAPLSRADRGAPGAPGLHRLWRRAAVDAPDDLRRWRDAARHAAGSAAGRQVQLLGQRRGDGALSAPFRPLHGAGLTRPEQGHASDLAGGGVPLFPDARA
jgi:hypothetical protein